MKNSRAEQHVWSAWKIQVNIWYVLASRNIGPGNRPPFPEGVRHLIMQFTQGDYAEVIAEFYRDDNQDLFYGLMRTAWARNCEDYATVLEYYIGKIRAGAKVGDFTELRITDDVANAAPALANGDRPRMDIIVAMLVRKLFSVYRENGERLFLPAAGEGFGDLTLPLTVHLGKGMWSHADRDADSVAREVTGQPYGGPNAKRPRLCDAPLWRSFEKVFKTSLQNASDYLVKLLAASAERGIPKLEVTEEVMAQAPKLPSGESVPLTFTQAKALHGQLFDCLLLHLVIRQQKDGFFIRYPGGEEPRDRWDGDDPALPFTLEVGYHDEKDRDDIFHQDEEGDEEDEDQQDEADNE